MALTLKKISELTPLRKTYLRGVECYNNSLVEKPQSSTTPFGGRILQTRVHGKNGLAYELYVELDQTDHVVSCECSCPSFRKNDGACKHIIAALVQQYYADVSGVGRSASTASVTPVSFRSDPAANLLIKSYLSQDASALVADTYQGEKIHLVPTLLFMDRRLWLELSIGRDRMYVIKSIPEFCEDVRSNASREYGKGTKLLCSRESFDQASLPLLDLVLSTDQDLAEREQLAGGRSNPRRLPLFASALDLFFDRYQGSTFAFKTQSGQEGVCTLSDAPVTVQITFEKSAERSGFYLSSEPFFFLCGGRDRSYLFKENTLTLCTKEFTAQMKPCLDILEQTRYRIFLSDSSVPEFCSSVLPAIQPYIFTEDTLKLLEEYIPETPALEIYLDAPAPDTITASVYCYYDDEKINPYEKDSKSSRSRNTVCELKYMLLLGRFFHLYDHSAGHLYFRGDDEQIFRLLTEGVDELSRHGAIYVTDNIKRINVSAPPPMSVGVRLSSGLLDITFDHSEFSPAELTEIMESYRRNRKFHRLKNGKFLLLGEGPLSAVAELAEGLSLSSNQLREGQVSVPLYRAMFVDKILQESDGLSFERSNDFRRLVKGIRAADDGLYEIPQSLRNILRKYQRAGFRWLKTLEHYGFGGILADDMGLGKTIQIITLLLYAKEKGELGPSLVVCPSSLVHNWKSEIQRFAPELSVLIVSGTAVQRMETLPHIPEYDVIVTSYDMLKRDVSLYQKYKFQYHILDEAQYIKNHTTQNARAVKQITSRYRFALTGTPIENRLSELWSIFDFLMPGLLFNYNRFRESIELPIVRDNSNHALERLSRMTAPFILRRLKADVLRELPPKTEIVRTIPLEEEQRKLYVSNIAEMKQIITREIDEKGFDKAKFSILSMLTRLRQICCHPTLCYENFTDSSAKLEACMELIAEAVDGGHKVLLFSQFTSMLSLIEHRLKAEKISYFLLTGATPSEQRASLVERFNRDDTSVFLISLRAGGTGLNLTGADTVIHFDPWWNLSVQNQATDRAYRIGQSNPVTVYKLIAENTVEEKILALQETKRKLADSVISEGDSLLSSMTLSEIQQLFSL
ncbi:MAG: DEAD/DEAH box helicase [Oscillospiraceae bacterium]|nr:DEAD/DEAH box helicase [Oscillospiraceae bacterium]